MSLDKWDERFTRLAKIASTWCKDVAQVGAVLVDKKRRVVGLSYNGFPKGVEDSADKFADQDQKNDTVIHAEINAILIAGEAAEGGTIYVSGKPVCSRCASVIIQAGIKRVVASPPKDGDESNWDRLGRLGIKFFEEAGLEFVH